MFNLTPTTVMSNLKTALTALGIFFVGTVAGYISEYHYRRFVRFLFWLFNGDNIQFYGKDFHLFPSACFVISSGLYASLAFLLLKNATWTYRIKRGSLSVIVFFTTTVLIAALDSKRLIMECTACDDGIRKLVFGAVAYDTYFITSLSASILYLFGAWYIRHL